MQHRVAIVGFLLVASLAGRAGADEFQEFASAKNAFEAGEYRIAATRFEELKAKGPKNKGLVEELHKLLGVSYLFLGQQAEAEASFIELLTEDPEFALDPLVFPIDVIDFFSEVKRRHGERLAALAAAKADEEASRLRAEEERRRTESERLKRNVYVEREIERRSLLVALLPFGAGQFQNGHKVKGGLLLGAEVLLSATAITTFIVHERLRSEAADPVASADERDRLERIETGTRVANTASLVALGVVAMAGIIDSLFYFRAEIVTWKQLDEKDVPPTLRPKHLPAAFAPLIGPDAIGLSAVAEF